MKFLLFFGAFLIVLINSIKSDDILVTTPNGQIKGQTRVTAQGVTFYSFQGIPFAEPPIGPLRFQAPVPNQPWDGVLDATHEKGCCYQMTGNRAEETEDCLYLNVFTPSEPTLNESIPVMFFIYGGGFIEGYSEEINYGPHHLMEQRVILVTSNYRVGPFGFLSTGDDLIPGNAGLKDQVLALKWVKENIQNFGGDPNRVTIFGQSAGAASVAYHLLSPLSKGLFSAAICESASALSPWAYQQSLVSFGLILANMINSQLDPLTATTRDLADTLMAASAQEIDDRSYEIVKMESPYYNQIQQGFFFTPTIEHEHEGAFLTKSMYELLETGQINNVPLIIGLNSEECLFYTNDLELWHNYTIAFDTDALLLTPKDMFVNESNEWSVGYAIKDYYSDETTFTEVPRNLIKYFSNQAFDRSVIKHAELQSKYGQVFFYEFAFHGVLGGYTEQSVIGFSDDVRHGEELSYIMTRGYGGLNTTDLSKYPEIDQTVQKRMITMFTNFAKYLNPIPEETELLNVTWPAVTPDNFQYMAIGSYLEVRKDLKGDMYSYWGELYQKYGTPPWITY